jgi:citrate lyase beta subunit
MVTRPKVARPRVTRPKMTRPRVTRRKPAPRPAMQLTLITRDAEFAAEAEDAGIERVMIDLETKGKASRQAGEGLFLSTHRVEDVARVKARLARSQLLVRVNPLGPGSQAEIDRVLRDGADVVMLPYFRDAEEVGEFVRLVGGRAVVSLLMETREAVARADAIVGVAGVDEIHVGLNDLRLSLGLDVIFEAVTSGLVESLAGIVRGAGIRFGFGGIGSLSATHLPVAPERILAEQVRLGASTGWLGRTFRGGMESARKPGELHREVALIRRAIERWSRATPAQHARNREALDREVSAWRDEVRRKAAQHA